MDEMLGRFGGPLAVNARDANGEAHTCGLCYRPIGRGAREAQLPMTGEWIHVTCVSMQLPERKGKAVRGSRVAVEKSGPSGPRK